MKPPDHIEDELKQIAPYLALLARSHPFTVPEGYFEGLEMKLTSMISQPNQNAKILFGSKEYPFRVPDDYFNELSSGILSKIKNEKQKIKPTIVFKKYLYDYKSWVAAASVAVILLISIALFITKKPASIALQSATTDNVSDLEYASDLNESVVVELYLEDQQEPDDSSANQSEDYLRDVVELNPEFMNEL
jgi:hypothetical protein